MVNQDNYFDLWDVFVNELIGDLWLTVFIGIILIILIVARTNTPYQVGILYLIIFLGVMYAIALSLSILWIFLLLFIGLLFYLRLIKIIK